MAFKSRLKPFTTLKRICKFADAQVGSKADIFSLGVILWQIVTLEPALERSYRPPRCAFKYPVSL
jgi:hypothetical protein